MSRRKGNRRPARPDAESSVLVAGVLAPLLLGSAVVWAVREKAAAAWPEWSHHRLGARIGDLLCWPTHGGAASRLSGPNSASVCLTLDVTPYLAAAAGLVAVGVAASLVAVARNRGSDEVAL